MEYGVIRLVQQFESLMRARMIFLKGVARPAVFRFVPSPPVGSANPINSPQLAILFVNNWKLLSNCSARLGNKLGTIASRALSSAMVLASFRIRSSLQPPRTCNLVSD